VSTVPVRRHSRELSESTSEDDEDDRDYVEKEDDEEEDVMTRLGSKCGRRDTGHIAGELAVAMAIAVVAR